MPLKKFNAKLLPELKELNLYSKKNLLSTAMAGEMISTLKGRGVEFEDYREYTVNDDATRIDWIASKRAQKVLVREYKLEINFNVVFVIDTSESMLFSSTKKLKCEYAAEVVTNLFFAILQAGNSVGFSLFNEKLFKFEKPLLGNKQFYFFMKEIVKPEHYGGKKNMTKSFEQLLQLLDKKALIFLVSDFLSPDNNWTEAFKVMARKHEVIGVSINDPRDFDIPKGGQYVLQDPYSEKTVYVDGNDYSTLYHEQAEKDLNVIKSIFKSTHSQFITLQTNENYINPLINFFRRSGARWR